MKPALSKPLHLLAQVSTIGLIFLFPLFFLPTTANFFETNKLTLLIAVVSLNLILWGAKLITERAIRFTVTPFTLPMVLLLASTILSSFFASGNPTEALIGRGGLFIGLSLLVLVGSTVFTSKKLITQGLYALIASSTVLSFVGVFQSLGFGLSNVLNRLLSTNIPDNLSFTPAGSPIALLSFVTPILVMTLFMAFTKKEMMEKIVLFILSAVMTSAVVLTLVYSLPGKETAPVILPLRHGYVIAVETLKNPKTALLGYGPEQFITAYNRTRPATMNLSTLWNVRFTGSSNELLQTITAQGLIGLAVWVMLGIAILRLIRQPMTAFEGKLVKFMTVGLFFLQLLIPGNYPLLFLTFVMIMLWSITLKNSEGSVFDVVLDMRSVKKVDPKENVEAAEAPILPFITGIPLILLALGMLYFTQKTYAAEHLFKRSLDAAAQNDGTQTYNLQRDAIIKNPYMARFRRAYSATNLALANSISSQGNLSDQDKSNVTQLIQQSIREAKAAVTLDPQNTANWESLIFVYRNLINVAQNADQWTVASYAQAIQNDPVNPRLRLEMGGVYYALGQYDQAIRLFQQAVELKPDWANAYYNLASAHSQKGELQTAYNYMRQVVALVEPDTADFTKAQQELADLAEKANIDPAQTNQAPAQGELTAPSPAPSPAPGQQVRLQEEAGPQGLPTTEPAPNNGDTVAATPTPAPTTTP